MGEVDHLNQKYLKVSNTSSHISLYIKTTVASLNAKNVFCGSLDALVQVANDKDDKILIQSQV